MECGDEARGGRIGTSRRFAASGVRRRGRARTLWATTLALAVAAFSGVWGGCAYAQNRVALIVGNGNYQNVPPLPTTLNDAGDVAQSFERLGFAPTKLFNASYDDFRRAIRKFNELTQNADIPVVYFAGHALTPSRAHSLLP